MSYIGELQANTAVDILIGPFVDETDGKTAETALTIDVELSKNGQTLVNKNDATAPVHEGTGTIDGYYNCELDATDTNTEGLLTIVCFATGALPVRHDAMVLSQAAWLSKYTAKDTGYLDVNVKAISEDTAAADNEEAFFDGTGYVGGTAKLTVDVSKINGVATTSVTTVSAYQGTTAANTAQTGDNYAIVNGAAGLVAIDTVVDAIKVKTDYLPSVTAGGAGGVFIAGANAATSVTTALTANITGNLSGTVGSVTGAVGSVTGMTASDVGAIKTMTDKIGTIVNTGGTATIGAILGDAANSALVTRIADIKTQTGTAGAGLTAIPWNAAWDAEVQSECDDAITASGIKGATFDTSTDSLEAIRDRGDAAWITGAGGDPWATALPGAYGAGTAGKIIGDNINAPVGTVDTVVDNIYAAVVTNAAGTDIAADIIAVKTQLDVIQADTDLLDDVSGGLADIHTDVGTAITNIGTVLTDTNAIHVHVDKIPLSDGVLTWNSTALAGVQTECEDAITASGIKGATFDTSTDSLEAIRNRGDAAWASGGTPPTAAAIADAVWDEAVADHTTGTTFGGKNQDVMRGTDNAALASVCTETRLAELDAANIPTDLSTIDTVVDAIKLKTDTLGGAGALTWTYTLTNSSTGAAIIGADVWVTTDIAGTNIVATGTTGSSGNVTFYLDAGTYYIWRQCNGYTFTNPDTEIVP